VCGISGWVGASPVGAEGLLACQTRVLTHRGPDHTGLAYGADWGMGFCRLSILDLTPAGHQPMRTPDGQHSLVFNGEIYNHLELRQQVLQAGARLVGTSDSEVLLNLLALHGAEALPRLNGMFALAFLDHRRGTFLLARDRLGKKPLYYQAHGRQLRFASELKALLAWPDASRELDRAALAEYLVHGNTRGPRVIFRGYAKLAPGHFLQGRIAEPGTAGPRQWWRPEVDCSERDEVLNDDDRDELAALLEDAVRIRLRSDVPVGVFLSGGIDSGLVAVIAGAAASGGPPLALTAGFDDPSHDESPLAALVAAQAGLPHRVVPVQPPKLEDVDRLAWFFDEPFADSSALPSLALCAAAAEHGKVFLSGDGGDEAFAGYRRYVEVLRHRWVASLPQPLRTGARLSAALLPPMSRTRYRLSKLAQPGDSFAASYDTIPGDPALRRICHPDLRPALDAAIDGVRADWLALGEGSLTGRQQQQDYEGYLPDDILVKMDRASMASSIEVRSPMLDHRLVEWASRLPRAALLHGGRGKVPLRALAADRLPTEVRTAPKRGFAIPVDRWLREPQGQALLQDRLLSREAADRGLWDVEATRRLISWHGGGRGRPTGSLLWRLLVLDAWARQYLDVADGPPHAPRPAAAGRGAVATQPCEAPMSTELRPAT
jgi:asparagine synthase (glutamine-hydrolysing)